ncbi:MAG: hypothetical protein HYV07_20390, partial [Deltaproteobacteria bacterium]|nr:hypothetical protein [Deltaproteobacteria bacterium]
SSLLFARVDGLLPSIDSSLHLVAPSASVGSIFLDGEITLAAWTPVAASGFSATSLPISPGLHRVDSMSPSVLVSGTTHGSRTRNTLGSSAESRLTRIGSLCAPSVSTPGDRLDNDCDGRIDEELGGEWHRARCVR